MTIRNVVPGLAIFLLASAALLGPGAPAKAATNATMTACFEQWQSAKDAGTMPKGEIWTKYYRDCAACMKKKAGANTAALKKNGPATASGANPAAKKKNAAVKPPPATTDTQD